MNAPARARRLHPPPLPSTERLYAERCRRSLSYFVQEAWKEIEQGEPVGFNGGYLDTICDHAAATFRGIIRNCVVNVINRSLKSQIASVFLPAWVWLNKPSERILSAAWEEALAIRDTRKTRVLLATPWYEMLKRTIFGADAWTIAADQNQKQFYENTAGGYRQATFVGGGTGKGGDFLIGDDLLSIDHSRSDVETKSAQEWVLRTFMGRRNNNTVKSRVFVAGHRLRPDDPYGVLLSKASLRVVHVPLPLEFDPAERLPPNVIGWSDPRTEPGQPLCPERWGPEEIAEAKDLYEDLYDAIANQKPSSSKSKPIKPEYIQRYTTLPPRLRIVQSWDTSFKGLDPTQKKVKRSRTAGLTWGFDLEGPGRRGLYAYLLDWWCDFADFNEQQDQIRAMHERWPETDTTWIEDEANGSALITVFQKEYRNVLPSLPTKSKYLRLLAVSRYFRSGNVLLPDDDAFPWVAGYVRRLLSFPSSDFNDEVDATSQVLKEEWLPKDLAPLTDGGEKLKASVRW